MEDKNILFMRKNNNCTEIYDAQKHPYIMQDMDKDKRNSIQIGIMKGKLGLFFFYFLGKPSFNSHRWCHFFIYCKIFARTFREKIDARNF